MAQYTIINKKISQIIRVNNLSAKGVKNASNKHNKTIDNILKINDSKYLPKNCLKFKLSFLNNAFKNLIDDQMAKNERKI